MTKEEIQDEFRQKLKDPEMLAKLSRAIAADLHRNLRQQIQRPVPDMPYIPGVTKPLDERRR